MCAGAHSDINGCIVPFAMVVSKGSKGGFKVQGQPGCAATLRGSEAPAL